MYELLKRRRPAISYFNVFGYACFILKQGNQQQKFETKADDGVLLGYSFISKAFGVYNVRKMKVVESIHVKFHEPSYAVHIENHPSSILNEHLSTHLSECSAYDIPFLIIYNVPST